MVTNKKIKTTESLQMRFRNGSKNLVIEIEKLIDHLSAAKKRIKTGIAITFSLFLYTKPMNFSDLERFWDENRKYGL